MSSWSSIQIHLRLHLVISSQFLRELELQLAQCLNERHGLDVADGTTKFDHACVTSNRVDRLTNCLCWIHANLQKVRWTNCANALGKLFQPWRCITMHRNATLFKTCLAPSNAFYIPSLLNCLLPGTNLWLQARTISRLLCHASAPNELPGLKKTWVTHGWLNGVHLICASNILGAWTACFSTYFCSGDRTQQCKQAEIRVNTTLNLRCRTIPSINSLKNNWLVTNKLNKLLISFL